MINHRRIDINKDKENLLQYHCEINYECESPFMKKIPKEAYTKKWMKLKGQHNEFLTALCSSMEMGTLLQKFLRMKMELLWAIYG